jgi:quinol monooxygenase YgiN
MSPMKYGYINQFTAQPGKRDELVAILLQAAQALEANRDCIQYVVGVAAQPETVWVTEVWTSKQAHDAALEPEDVKATIARAMPLIASISNVAEQQIAGGKGLNE